MFSKAARYLTILILLTCLTLQGCSTGQSRVWVDEKTSFNAYEALEVRPVFNATGEDLQQDIPAALTTLLTEQLESRGFLVTRAWQANTAALIVENSIVFYQGCRINKGGTQSTGLSSPSVVSTGSAGTTQGQSTCTVQTQLIDKATGNVVAKIFTTKAVGACFTDQFKNQWLFKVLAEDIARKVAKIMKA
jgi:hypothetical protein